MDRYKLLERSSALRRGLSVWNGLCIAAGGLCLVATIGLAIASGGDDIGSGVAGALAFVAFLAVFVVGVAWVLGREVLIGLTGLRHTRRRRRMSL